jgi:hypothetical protein
MNEQPVATCESQDFAGQIYRVLPRPLHGRVWNLKLKIQDILLSKAFERAHFFDTVYVRFRTLAAGARELRPTAVLFLSIYRIGASQLLATASVLNSFRAIRELRFA